jgi:enoyl-CoA hydratase/carnithine racemase
MTELREVPLEQSRFSELLYAVTDGVARITLNRPAELNSFSTNLYRELRDAVRLATIDDMVDIVVITGTGRAFATGGDLKEVLAYLQPDADPLDIYRFEDNLPFETVRQCPKVTIAAVNGICMAGGLITTMSCDISVAVADAVFAAPEGKVGVAEGWMPAVMFGRVSLSKMRYLALTGTAIPADKAERWGLITEVVPDADALDRRVSEIIEEVRGTSPAVRRSYKQTINDIAPTGKMGDFREGTGTPDGIEGLSAFAEKRRPRYRNGTAHA